MESFGHTVADHGDHLRLTLAGDVDFAAHAALVAQIGDLVQAGRSVVVDCAGVTFLDSMGLRALVEGLQAAQAKGLDFELADPSRPVLRVLELSGTTELFPIRGTVPEQAGTGAAVPEALTPQEVTPLEVPPQAVTPEAVTPEAVASEGVAPEGAASENSGP